MNVAKVLESGLTGAATLTLLQETLDQLDPKAPDTKLLHKKGIIRQLKSATRHKGFKAVKRYVSIASELLSMLGYYGLSGLGKKKNAVLRGGILGALAGTVVAFVQDNDDDPSKSADEVWRKRIITIALYIIGGLIAGKTAQYMKKKKKK